MASAVLPTFIVTSSLTTLLARTSSHNLAASGSVCDFDHEALSQHRCVRPLRRCQTQQDARGAEAICEAPRSNGTCGLSGRWPEQAALSRPSAVRGFRGPADRTSGRNRGRLGFWKSLLATASVKLLLRPRIRKTP